MTQQQEQAPEPAMAPDPEDVVTSVEVENELGVAVRTETDPEAKRAQKTRTSGRAVDKIAGWMLSERVGAERLIRDADSGTVPDVVQAHRRNGARP